MEKAQVACLDYHMPRASKSAEALSPPVGDVRTHNGKIAINPAESMFTEDGEFATGILTLDVVCLKCHGNRDIAWAASKAAEIHAIAKEGAPVACIVQLDRGAPGGPRQGAVTPFSYREI